jgi:hypothetical protein
MGSQRLRITVGDRQSFKELAQRVRGNKYLWGNTPALDIFKSEQNERVHYREDLELLFAGPCFIQLGYIY